MPGSRLWEGLCFGKSRRRAFSHSKLASLNFALSSTLPKRGWVYSSSDVTRERFGEARGMTMPGKWRGREMRSVVRFGQIDLRAQAAIASARRSDTPKRLAAFSDMPQTPALDPFGSARLGYFVNRHGV